ncbi:MAG TPA: DNA alkylation repair protein [Caulobacteraceae bacterium]|nr:DNA alkylation repair protein [Caulobacteraceae bacterium]
MDRSSAEAKLAAGALIADITALGPVDTPAIRRLRRARTAAWKLRSPDFIAALALELSRRRAFRWVGYELVRFHRPAFAALDDRLVATLAVGLDSWGAVDGFARILAGPAWARGAVSDGLIEAWSRSPDRWLRRAALVCTVALNMPADGGRGDTARTLAVCARLASDRDDMVVKALSWALRILAAHDPGAVASFLAGPPLAARVMREVGHKMRTGRKSGRDQAKP